MATKNKFAGLSDEERLKKLSAMPEKDIDYSDIPNMSKSKNWKKVYPNINKNISITNQMVFDTLSKIMLEEEPHKIPVTIKLDQKIVDFFKQHSKKYQTKINEVLLAFVNSYEKSHNH